MYTAYLENSAGEILYLTQSEQQWQVVNIEGLDSPTAVVNVTDIATLDGGKFNSARLPKRNIVITLRLNGEVEENRLMIYHLFRTKEAVTFYYANDSLSVKIDGIIEATSCPIFTNNEVMQISIICPYPYFRALESTETPISNRHPLFKFPFAINLNEPMPFSDYSENRITTVINDSQTEQGCIIQITALPNDTGYVSGVAITNADTGDALIINQQIPENAVVTVNTVKGQKSVTMKRVDGTVRNIFNTVQLGSVFFQLAVGVNRFTYTAGGGDQDKDVEIVFIQQNEYRGV